MKSAWPVLPAEVLDAVTGPRTTAKFGVETVERCPKCRSSNIKWGRGNAGIRCECMNCRKNGGFAGPPASDNLKGSSAKETMWLRRDEAYRLWNVAVLSTRFVPGACE